MVDRLSSCVMSPWDFRVSWTFLGGQCRRAKDESTMKPLSGDRNFQFRDSEALFLRWREINFRKSSTRAANIPSHGAYATKGQFVTKVNPTTGEQCVVLQ